MSVQLVSKFITDNSVYILTDHLKDDRSKIVTSFWSKESKIPSVKIDGDKQVDEHNSVYEKVKDFPSCAIYLNNREAFKKYELAGRSLEGFCWEDVLDDSNFILDLLKSREGIIESPMTRETYSVGGRIVWYDSVENDLLGSGIVKTVQLDSVYKEMFQKNAQLLQEIVH
jgi:hypothetical protein